MANGVFFAFVIEEYCSGVEAMCSQVVRTSVCPLTPISCDAISLYPVEGFQ